MTITLHLDERGAVVLPEELRTAWGLVQGSAVLAEQRPEGLLLRPAKADKPLWQVIAEAAEALPPSVVRDWPTDGAEQHDHYLYGTPKR